jgi:hypothetical protein
MVGAVPPWSTVSLPRRSPAAGDQVRHWYENELGWPTVPGDPVRLALGLRFDVLEVPAEAGRAALRRLPPGCPVALRGDRMALLVAAGSAEELPGLLEWLEWGGLPLDLTALGAGTTMEAPLPAKASGGPGPGGAPYAPAAGAERALPASPRVAPAAAPAECGALADVPRGGAAADARDPRAVPSAPHGPASGSPGPQPPLGLPGTSQGAAVWLRPPVPGCEVEASLPSPAALGGGGDAPDLARLVDAVATQCHRVRLMRACAQPLAFS